MSDLISRSALIKAIDAYMKNAYDCPLAEVADFQSNSFDVKCCYTLEGLYEATEIIDVQPTIEAVPVSHGEWILRHIGAGHMWECSVCHKRPDIYVKKDTNFCPNCGAKMKGGVE